MGSLRISRTLPTETEAKTVAGRLSPEKPDSGTLIPLCVPEISGNAWAYVRECLDTGWVSSVGSFVDRFERTMAEYVGTPYAVATVNGTAALHIALLAAGTQPEEEVLISTLTFVAPANAIRYCGAWPVFMDADPQYWQIDPEKMKDFLEKECQWRDGGLWNRQTNRRVRAILPVHVLGHPCDMEPILELAQKYKLTVIEDATECLGARYRGQMAGSLGDIACFSFNGNKIITTGGGGMIVTRNAAWASRAKHLTTQAKSDPVEYLHDEIGYNYRLVNLLAALGCAQLEQLDTFIARKREIANTYRRAFADLPGVSCMRKAEWAESIDWMFTVFLHPDVPCGRRTLMNSLQAKHIQTRPLWCPLHRLPMYVQSQGYRIEMADRLYEGCLSLPCSVSLKDDEQKRVVDAVFSIVRGQ
ncbi:MAG: LegC family aminotransferase [Candidatus Latescibacteria bacterium]|nr:LegC family aminotransferase [Candidatus Latescibacterota bacterium]